MKYCEAYAPEQNGDPVNDALYLRNQRVEEELGVKINVYPLEQRSSCGTELQKLIMASEDVIDISYMNGNNMSMFMGTGLIIDLYQIPNVDFTHSWWDQHSVKEFELFGTLPTVTGDISLYLGFSPVIYLFNKTVVENYKFGNLYDLVRNNEWVIPKVFEMCRAVAHDVNGDGKMDVEDCYGLMTETGGLGNMVISGGVRLTKKDSEGVPQIMVNGQRTIDLIEMCVPFINDKDTNILASNFSSRFPQAFRDFLLPTFADDRALFFNNQLLVAVELRSMEADFGILPPPKFDSSQDNFYCPTSSSWCTYILVPATNGKFEMTGHVLESMGYYSQQEITPAYIDTTVMNKALRDDESAEMLQLIFSNYYYDLAMIYDWGTIYTMFSTMAANKNVNYASEFAKIETRIQTEIEKTIDMLR